MITGYWPCRGGWFYATTIHCGIVPDKNTAKHCYDHYTKEEGDLSLKLPDRS